jgi:CRP/FNR family transcriptional regulator
MRVRREPPLRRGADLVRWGERPCAVYLVVSGAIILRRRDAERRERVSGFRLPGELVGIEACGRAEHAYTARALVATSVCRLQPPCAGGPQASTALLERLLLKCAALLDSAAPWPGLAADERVAAFIADYARRSQGRASPAGLIRLPMSRADIGSYLGLAEETVVRSLRRLRSGGRLTVRGRTVEFGETQV